MAYILDNLAQSYIVLGLILLTIEVTVFGFSTFVLFFVGIATIITGGLIAAELVPATVLASLLTTAVVSLVVALVSWRPLKSFQNDVEVTKVDNDMVGHRFFLSEDLSVGRTVNHRYSGIDWQLQAKENLALGTHVSIVEVKVGILVVSKVADES
ncbi:MAG: NfeD family protein [Gammaproteobacteria bacterium]|nr:NfeD family protein [Gammaproteobacteria bacterium]